MVCSSLPGECIARCSMIIEPLHAKPGTQMDLAVQPGSEGPPVVGKTE